MVQWRGAVCGLRGQKSRLKREVEPVPRRRTSGSRWEVSLNWVCEGRQPPPVPGWMGMCYALQVAGHPRHSTDWLLRNSSYCVIVVVYLWFPLARQTFETPSNVMRQQVLRILDLPCLLFNDTEVILSCVNMGHRQRTQNWFHMSPHHGISYRDKCARVHCKRRWDLPNASLVAINKSDVETLHSRSGQIGSDLST